MGWLGTTQQLALLLGVAAVAALCGYLASTVARRDKPRARGYFLVGLFCGYLAGGVLRRKRHGTGGFVARALTLASHAQPRRALTVSSRSVMSSRRR
jgi:hypothetical protein